MWADMPVNILVQQDMIDRVTKQEAVKWMRLDIFDYFYKRFVSTGTSGTFTDPFSDPIFQRLAELGYTPQGTNFDLMAQKGWVFDCRTAEDIAKEGYFIPLNKSLTVQKNYNNEYIYGVVVAILTQLPIFHRNYATRLALYYFLMIFLYLVDDCKATIEDRCDRLLWNLAMLNDHIIQDIIVAHLFEYAIEVPDSASKVGKREQEQRRIDELNQQLYRAFELFNSETQTIFLANYTYLRHKYYGKKDWLDAMLDRIIENVFEIDFLATASKATGGNPSPKNKVSFITLVNPPQDEPIDLTKPIDLNNFASEVAKISRFAYLFDHCHS